jgi:hypothetical protein
MSSDAAPPPPPPLPAAEHARIAAAIEALARPRAARGATVCPSEVARALEGGSEARWRALMPAVRAVAAAMPDRVAATQRGAPVDALAARGPIRLRWVGPP